MASWMIHLRVAQGIYEKLNLVHKKEFVMGNIAPDSGLPKVDGTGFEPDAEVSHFRTIDENGIKDIHEELFVDRYFTKEKREKYSAMEYAFYFGYLIHLLTDKLWASQIVYGAKEKLPDLFEQDNVAFWKKVKQDWYDLDFLYLKKHPEFEAFQIYEGIEQFKNIYLTFFVENAFEQRKQFIVEFYRNGVATVEERETYISAKELDAFVEDAVKEIESYVKTFIDNDGISKRQENMFIRKANVQDAFAIAKISSDDLGYKCDEELVSKRLINLNHKREAVFVAEIDNVIVGYIHAEIYNLLYYESTINILGIAVLYDYRRHGVGKELLKHIEIWAKELRISTIRLNSGSNRKEAHAFYRVMGFDSEKEQICFNKRLD